MAGRPSDVATVVIGAGQAGLASSYELTRRGLEHVVLERGRIGEAWRRRWDSLCMIIPNRYNELPGFSYQGPDPDGFQTRDEWVNELTRYAAETALPVHQGVEVRAVHQRPDRRFSIETSNGALDAENVIVATGAYQAPRIPEVAAGMDSAIHQIHSSSYRNPAALPPGAVLVVGSGNSGSQIAEELYRSGRTVYLSVGYSSFPLRRYRGRDLFWWYFNASLHQFRGEEGELRGLGNITGHDGGRALNLRDFWRDGVHLLGRIRNVDGSALTLAPDLLASLAHVDRLTADFRRAVDEYIATRGIDAPPDEVEPEAATIAAVPESPTSLDLNAAGVTTVIWSTGYGWDVRWLNAPVHGPDGKPLNRAGISPCDGLYFAGMSTIPPLSTSINRVGQEAVRLGAAIAERYSLDGRIRTG